jgi:hypothetical protein
VTISFFVGNKKRLTKRGRAYIIKKDIKIALLVKKIVQVSGELFFLARSG